ncbi:hypothetical protein [Nostoc sp. NMS4]|uniref:hypothetical protein n=1 Tax=Nostoc sp. NMS4 TaxID=2815390 RepID=UPI0025D188CA|nr:hypothetical protein [Nostoc sp. NMS4]MBN3922480.1 hypothetical protein [Nostoc sp. NMS4]
MNEVKYFSTGQDLRKISLKLSFLCVLCATLREAAKRLLWFDFSLPVRKSYRSTINNHPLPITTAGLVRD